ncbi:MULTISPECIES: hypothetical protein [unclassified Janthinobacterium]|uniref:hypothetical protein n=1 Tax=unclassified Janthinobacterium TaxID=2610881 RepID=UPI00161A07C2|nr:MULTISPECIES: hypothetical protein [unclassified Janthinobacterium]MBB5369515.1 hypothetical protein [Janthinobacterium sp. K2C7]MBB5382529.1 hypothetical protein [Janthinobacterium sp. K2Li3]MBB5388106.1 hypothetical protein [Janthinobacterium sp. K2E3]
MHSMTRPSKEQVRAYMRRRENARKAPPAPEEIRRQLASSGCDISPASMAAQGWQLSADLAQLGSLMAIAWLMDSGIALRKN